MCHIWASDDDLATVTRLLQIGLGVEFSSSQSITAGKVWWSSWWQNHVAEVLHVTANEEAERVEPEPGDKLEPPETCPQGPAVCVHTCVPMYTCVCTCMYR